jgi:CRISPR/Cas system endoribonuclease Cas6 (RAMP superfamily)
MEELVAADPERLNAAKGKAAAAGFDYAIAVQQAAEFCTIPASNYKLSSQAILKSEGQKTQSANVSLKGVKIAEAARFLSSIQQRWSGLQCTKINFRKNKGQPDAWDVDLTFKYYY